MSKWVFVNNDFVKEEDACLHFRDLSIQRGYGIFDFLKVADHLPVFIDDHLNRFYFSAAQMHLQVGRSKEEMKEIIRLLIEKNATPACGIRITLTGGYSPDGYTLAEPNLILSQHSLQFPTTQQFEKGIKLVAYQHQRQLPHVKTIDYLMAIWLQPHLAEREADDVLYFHSNIITECPRSNFFLVTKDDKLVTPVNNILKGITRMKLLDIARADFDVVERDIQYSEIVSAKEAFITSTTKSILPVSQIDGHIFPPQHPVAVKLYKLLNQVHKVPIIPFA